jgi:hypothetical protein
VNCSELILEVRHYSREPLRVQEIYLHRSNGREVHLLEVLFHYELVRLEKFKNARRFTNFDPRVAVPCKVGGNDGSDRSNTMSAPEAAQSIDVGS